MQERAPSPVPSELGSSCQLQQDGRGMCGCLTGKWEPRGTHTVWITPNNSVFAGLRTGVLLGKAVLVLRWVWVTNPPSLHKTPDLLHETVVKFGGLQK